MGESPLRSLLLSFKLASELSSPYTPGPQLAFYNKYQSYYGRGRRPLAYLLYYGKPRLPPVHKYSSLYAPARIVLQASRAGRWATRTAPAVKIQCPGPKIEIADFPYEFRKKIAFDKL